MELLFRKYFWAVNLVFLFFVALIAARTVNLFTEASLTQVPTSAPAQANTRHTPLDVPAGLNLERLAELTGLPLPKPEPTVSESDTQTAYDPNAAPVKTSLRVRLLGTLDATQSRWSLASIQDMSTQDTATYMVGDTIQGATIVAIERERVIINNNGRREYIDGEAGTGVTVATAPPIRTSQPVNDPDSELGQGIKAVDENNYEIPRDTVDNALSNLNTLAMQARIVPAFKDGKSEGFRLFSIRPDSLYSKIGIVNGDVLRRINGFDLNSPEKALEVYQKLKDTSRIDIEIDRNGTLVHKTYNIH